MNPPVGREEKDGERDILAPVAQSSAVIVGWRRRRYSLEIIFLVAKSGYLHSANLG